MRVHPSKAVSSAGLHPKLCFGTQGLFFVSSPPLSASERPPLGHSAKDTFSLKCDTLHLPSLRTRYSLERDPLALVFSMGPLR
jgi:hypothetical protein